MFIIIEFLSAVLAQNLVHLIRPLDDDPLDCILELSVTVLARACSRFLLLLINVSGSLGEGEQSLALDVTSDLIHTGGQLMNLLLYI